MLLAQGKSEHTTHVFTLLISSLFSSAVKGAICRIEGNLRRRIDVAFDLFPSRDLFPIRHYNIILAIDFHQKLGAVCCSIRSGHFDIIVLSYSLPFYEQESSLLLLKRQGYVERKTKRNKKDLSLNL